jgi:hypothetical protein
MSLPPAAGQAARALIGAIRRRLADDAGYTTETVIVTAILAAAALTIIAIIVAKVLGAANGINV